MSKRSWNLIIALIMIATSLIIPGLYILVQLRYERTYNDSVSISMLPGFSIGVPEYVLIGVPILLALPGFFLLLRNLKARPSP